MVSLIKVDVIKHVWKPIPNCVIRLKCTCKSLVWLRL